MNNQDKKKTSARLSLGILGLEGRKHPKAPSMSTPTTSFLFAGVLIVFFWSSVIIFLFLAS